MELHKITLKDGSYTIEYKQTLKDIDGKDVVMPAETIVKSMSDLKEEVAYWEAQAGNCQYQLDRVNGIIKSLPVA